MRKLLSLIVLLLAAVGAQAQSTAVTGTITDPNGLPYSGAVINVQLAPAPSGAASCGNSTLQSLGSTDADANGTFALNLCPNASITPGGSQWQFNVSVAGIPPPSGFGPQTFSVLVTIAGASQSVSAALSAAAPALSRITGGGGGTPCVLTANSLQINNGGAFGCISTLTFSGGVLTGASGLTVNLAAANLKLPAAAGFVSTATNSIGLDTNAQNVHIFANSVDNINLMSPASGTFTNGDAATISVVSGVITIADFGAAPVTNFNQLVGTAGAAQLTLTTNGDIPARIGGVLARLPQGSSGQVLSVVGGVLQWATPAAGGTVTHTLSALTANQFLCGNGGADIKLADTNGCLYPMGTITTDIQPLKVTWTQNAAGVVFNGIEIVVTDTAHASGSQIFQIFGGSAATTNLLKLDTAGNLVINGSLTTGVAGTTGSIALSGSTSGTITIKPQAVAGTYEFDLPITAGTAGQVLTSQGGGGTAMTWTTPSGSGTVTNFTSGNLSPVFTTSVATPTTTPALTFTLSNAAAGTFLGNNTSAAAAPAYVTLSAINPQTSTYQVLASDFSAYKTISVASGTFTVTLVASGSQPANGQYINVVNYGSGVVTVARSGQNINGAAANYTLNAGSASAPTSTTIYSDGTNYFASIDQGTVGTVTSIATTAPITGGTITSSGTIACATCATTATGGAVKLSDLAAANASNTIANGNFPQTLNWAQTTDAQDAFTFGETSAATGGTLTNALANQAELFITTLSGSTAVPLEVQQSGITAATGPPALQVETSWNNASLVGEGLLFNATNTSSAAGSKLFDFRVGNTAEGTLDKAGNAVFATSMGTGTVPACTAGTGGALCQTEGTSATGLASTDIFDANSTQHAASVNNNNTGDMPVSRVACVSVAPVTVAANVTTDQLLMSCTLSANLLNVVGRTLKVTTASIYSTPAASVSQMTEKIKLCTVSGCGSGTVVTLVSIQSSALGTIAVTNNAIQLPVFFTTQTAGASSTYEAHGCLNIDLNASISGADTVFCDTNTAVSAAIDSTAQLFLQVTGAFSTASASNSWSERQLIVEVLN